MACEGSVSELLQNAYYEVVTTLHTDRFRLSATHWRTTQAMNLLKAGFEVTVWNRTPEKSEALVKAGAHVCDTP